MEGFWRAKTFDRTSQEFDVQTLSCSTRLGLLMNFGD